MVDEIRAAFARAQDAGRAAFVAYLMAGYPDVATSIELALAVAAAGADVIELGVPFSDPLADGATIQRAGQRALEQGMTLVRCLEVAQAVTEGIGRSGGAAVPLALMGHYNPFLRLGLAELGARTAAAGVSGLIVPDLPAEEAEPLVAAVAPHGIHPIFLVTPTSSEPRITRTAAAAHAAESGFIYCVSLSGVTGARDELPAELPDFIARVRRAAGDLPLGIGFGIARPAQAAAMARLGDGIVVGSALLNAYDQATPGAGVQAVAQLVRALRDAARRKPA